jgi:hypothetical protein
MASKSSYLKSKTKSRGEDVELVPVRSNVFYGIQTKVIDEQKSNIERKITVVPNITFYDNFTKALIDFSDYLNNPESSSVKPFFDLLINGLNFTITNSTWANPSVDKTTFDLSGTYKFLKIVDNIVFAEVVSINSYSSKITRYDKEFFEQLPTIQLSITVTPTKKETKSYIFNYLGKNSKNSFSFLGMKVGDYVQIQNQVQKYKIDSYEIDAEGKETVIVFGELSNSNFVGTPLLITLNQKNINKIQLTYDNNTLGKCELTTNNSIVECIDNHTELQSKLREDNFNNIKSIFYPNQFCVGLLTDFEVNQTTNVIQSLTQENLRLKNQLIKPTQSTIDSSLLSSRNLLKTLFQ